MKMDYKIKIIFFIFLLFFDPTQLQAGCTNVHNANLRANPSLQARKITKLRKFTPLDIVERKEDWLKVKGHNFTGWIYGDLVSKLDKCMAIINPKGAICPSDEGNRKRPIVYHEGFKILKKDIACNLALDRYGNKVWLNSLNAWPKDQRMFIRIPRNKLAE